MEQAYHPEGTTSIVEALLNRKDLDINETKATSSSNRWGVENNTLLDMIVSNCMVLPTGHDRQQKPILANSRRWLLTLKQMSTHSSFSVTNDNIQKAQECLTKLTSNYPTQNITEAIKIATEALELIKNSPKRI
ncbi:MAG: hypothetical protein BGO68_03490 [Candidatus Amoebophilus sp. 36-38]|nr:MAG: hypothetical protein BGO68_03490 [Candidatus Amoebophilus sp. 36-38]